MNKKPTPIQKAIEAAGGRHALASRLGIHPSMISQWVIGHRPIAAHHVIAIEEACGRAVTRHDLRPDVFGPAPSKQAEARHAA